jgi:hypothetical protein
MLSLEPTAHEDVRVMAVHLHIFVRVASPSVLGEYTFVAVTKQRIDDLKREH